MLPLRKHRISRLEEFSDAVFGFALTLLVITTSVPRSYDDLVRTLEGIPAFACCFALLVWIWHEHDSFFERYPLQDGLTVFLTLTILAAAILSVMVSASYVDRLEGRMPIGEFYLLLSFSVLGALLVASALFGIEANGARRWIRFSTATLATSFWSSPPPEASLRAATSRSWRASVSTRDSASKTVCVARRFGAETAPRSCSASTACRSIPSSSGRRSAPRASRSARRSRRTSR